MFSFILTRPIFYGWWIVLASFAIALLVAGTVFYGFTAFFEPIVEEFGWSYTQISLVSALRGLEMGLLAPFVGFMAHRFGSRSIVFAGIITVGIGLFVLSQGRSLLMFYAAFLILSLGAGGCTTVVLMNAVANWFQRDVGKALGVVASGFGASGLVVPAIVWLIDRFHWQAALQIIAVCLLTLGIPLCLVIRNRPEDHGLLPDGDRSIRGKTMTENGPKEEGVGFRTALKARGFWYLCASEALRFMVLSAVVIHIMPYLSGLGIPRHQAGFIAAALPLLSIIGRFSFGWLADIYDKRYVMCTTFVLMGLGFLSFTYMGTGWLLISFLALFPPAFGGGMVLRGAILRDYFGRTSFSRLLGITMGIASIGGILGPVIAGWVFDTTGAYHSVWLAYSMILFIPVALLLMIDPHAVKETASH